ncbi:MAG: zinc-ribbon domain-containing protein [Thermodesulfovibrionales bacterium]|nr:zinc-ribbon domain-containing protein [Thermodesulfovibrionales bacterium]
MICAKCNAENINGANFCSKCGLPLICTNCGAQINSLDNFCPKCGISLTVKNTIKNSTEKKEYDFKKMSLYFFVPFLLVFVGTYERAGAWALPNAIFGGILWLAIFSAIFGNKKKK